jgi:hypothetical protein
MMLGLEIAAGTFILLAFVFTIVFGVLGRFQRRRMAEYRAALEREGIVRDSGTRRVWVHYRNYRRPGFRATASHHSDARALVLTRQSFAIVGFRMERCPLAEMDRYQVSVIGDGKRLRLVTERPIDATGRQELSIQLDDAQDWERALREAGAIGEAGADAAPMI